MNQSQFWCQLCTSGRGPGGGEQCAQGPGTDHTVIHQLSNLFLSFLTFKLLIVGSNISKVTTYILSLLINQDLFIEEVTGRLMLLQHALFGLMGEFGNFSFLLNAMIGT